MIEFCYLSVLSPLSHFCLRSCLHWKVLCNLEVHGLQQLNIFIRVFFTKRMMLFIQWNHGLTIFGITIFPV